MKSKCCILCFCSFFLATLLQAQVSEDKQSVVHLGVWYPISTNGKLAKEYTNDFSFHLFYGVSKSERAFVFSGLGSTVAENAMGLQFAGLFNVIGGKATGLTFSGLFNITGEARAIQIAGLANVSQNIWGMQFSGLTNLAQDVKGLQIGGLVNVSQNLTGMQFAGLANVSQNITGMQIGGLFNMSQNLEGMQFSGLFNLSQNIKGSQVGGIFNISKDIDGMQFAGLANVSNITKGVQIAGLGNISVEMRGFQFSGLGNITQYVKGLQIAGLGNISKEVNGFQFGGLFNKASDVKGVQMAGLINIAEHSDYPIGLINLIKDGEKSIGVTFDELQNTILAFRSGGRVLYGVLGVGYCFKASESLMAFEGGFGAYINIIPKFRINTELTFTTMTQFSDLEISRSSLRVLPAFKFTSHFEVFAGPSINFMQTSDPELYDMFPKGSMWDDLNSFGDKSQLNIGYTIGLQYCF